MEMTMKILLADSDTGFAKELLENWDLAEASLATVNSTATLLKIFQEERFEVLFLSVDLFHHDELDVLSYIREHYAQTEVITLCSARDISKAEQSLSKGVASYLVKPVSPETIKSTARKTLTRNLSRKSYRLMEDHVLEDLLGNTPEMKKILRTIYKVAPTNSTILITGESGTGKEFVANIIHRLSKRSENQFVAVNCGALPENIVESELFGARKGAYTGAFQNKKGLFEEAESGTLFLDEVGELSAPAQVKLLRFLQSKEIRKVGDTESKHIDVRIIAATNRNLQEAIQDGIFREDLYYRLNVFQIHLPPLRHRKITIPHLVRFFVMKYNQENGKNVARIHPSAQMALTTYEYPGNIRELENIIEHALVLCEGDEIKLEDLPEFMVTPPHSPTRALPTGSNAEQTHTVAEDEQSDLMSLAEVEKRHIMHALDLMSNNQSEVAKKLGISRSTLWRKLQEHKIKI
jgi:DNA-binding NtrC family response regulator